MICDPDPPVVLILSDTKPVARKVHRCGWAWCKEPIKAGERYRRIAMIDDEGKFQCFREHAKHSSQELGA